ncbi:MAG: putative O-glycosylation ligase, exosortase A system-associated [Planctomycetes bacterium]|nr:putative O-glycosylation ligase, exosortase A system-associated [Planctomycetota bacterium]
MRDAVVFLIVVAGLPIAFRKPFIGLLLFSWLAYMRPQDLCWGFARDMRLSFYVGLALIAGFVATELGRRPFMRRDIRTASMIVILLLTYLSTALAEYHDPWIVSGLIEFTKIVAIACITSSQVDSKQRLRVMVMTIAMCLGFFGFKGGLYGLLGGGSINRGPGGMMEDNNDFALALVMSLPMLYYLGVTEKQPLLKRFFYLTLGLTCLTVMLTHSRGGFLSMCVVFAVFTLRAGKILQGAMVGGSLAAIFLLAAPRSVVERLSTINEAAAGADASANARLFAWQIGLHMIEENFWIGIGHKNFRLLYQHYARRLFPGEDLFNHVAHNSYIQMFAETGVFAFGAFMTMLVSTFFAAGQLRRIARMRPDLAWVRSYGSMAEATIAGFMLGGFFLNRAHFDLLYHWLGIVTAMVFVARMELAREPATATAGAARASGELLRVGLRPATLGPSQVPRWERRGV